MGGAIPDTRRDGEPLTDLVTVYLGMGIFTANAVQEHWHTAEGQGPGSIGRWHTARQGYGNVRVPGSASGDDRVQLS